MLSAKTLLGCSLAFITFSLICKDKADAGKNEPARTSEYPIEPLFLKRQSNYDLHRTLSESEMREKLNQLFAAFIWAPSSFNNQPGRLVYALYGTKDWDTFYDLLGPFNKEWAKNAGALILVLSRKNYERNEKFCKTHSFDTGAAVENLLLQTAAMGLVGHVMEGFDYEKARKKIKVPKGYAVEVMIAIGERASKKYSTKEFAQRDSSKAQRKKIAEFVCEGTFKL